MALKSGWLHAGVLTPLFVLYPLYIWFAIQYLSVMTALLPLVALLIARGLLFSAQGLLSRGFYLVTASFLLIALWQQQSETALLFYPVWINLGMLAIFAWSLFHPPSVITRIATLMEGPLDEKGIDYTENVTRVWCVFFIFNGSMAAGLAWSGNWDLWVLYNGLIAYVLIGLLMFIEWRVRKIVRAKN